MREETIKSINRYLFIILRLSLLIAIIIEILSQRWFTLFITILTIILTYIPWIIEKWYKLNIPDSFEILIILFIYSSIYLGEVHEFYIKFWWWDILLHFSSAIALGIIGFTILLILYEKEKVSANPFWISLFIFSFALSIGAVWEIFEFSMDNLLGTNMQKPMLGDYSGLTDTMIDLIMDSLGALIVAIIGYLYIKTNKGTYITKTVEHLVKGIKQKTK